MTYLYDVVFFLDVYHDSRFLYLPHKDLSRPDI